ncbi:MAG TPA: hypothetical protein ENJ82_06915 [Bacteroidetes bacterium]|nr:hypothetical protein [Bacteroidota bacterium]
MRLRSGTARGPVNSNGDQSITKMRYNANTIDIGLGYFFVNKEMTQWALGASLDFGQMRIKMRRGTASQVAGQVWSRTVSDLNLGASIFVQGMVIVSRAPQIGIYFRPYYQFGFFENDLGPANRYLRPQIRTAKPYFIYQRPSNIGLKVGIYFGG